MAPRRAGPIERCPGRRAGPLPTSVLINHSDMSIAAAQVGARGSDPVRSVSRPRPRLRPGKALPARPARLLVRCHLAGTWCTAADPAADLYQRVSG